MHNFCLLNIKRPVLSAVFSLLLVLLEENDDVQQVFHNMLLTEEIVNAINN